METPQERVWLGVRGWQRPRTRWFLLAGILLVLLGAAIWGAAWWTHYQPLDSGCCHLKGHVNNRIEYGWTVANRGSHTVRITSVDDPSIPGMFTDVRMFLGPEGEPGTFEDFNSPLRPFELAPGEERLIVVTGRVPCPSPREGYATMVQQRVHYRAFSLSRETWVPISPVPLKPPRGTCRSS
jgi:hypothetical protein